MALILDCNRHTHPRMLGLSMIDGFWCSSTFYRKGKTGKHKGLLIVLGFLEVSPYIFPQILFPLLCPEDNVVVFRRPVRMGYDPQKTVRVIGWHTELRVTFDPNPFQSRRLFSSTGSLWSMIDGFWGSSTFYRKGKTGKHKDDAILMARTASRLQSLLNSFESFMGELDLSVSLTKSYIMVVEPKSTRAKTFSLNYHLLTKFQSFSYLGVLFDNKLSWIALAVDKRQDLRKSTGAISSFAARLRSTPLKALINVYQAKCESKVLYGCDIWGYRAIRDLQIEDNQFLRRILCVPQSAPSFSVPEQPGAKYLSVDSSSSFIVMDQDLVWVRT
ncbi:hypothetical protein NDU88_004331 [Pleurodeles waltl]|uniref:Uncharacterized protein n=1 Tax=Pleurodeles waltl TaxID=8319 RepID=A0AAV7N153_PLEWA|nr:hypothetical protein NDU88_004331 [Pleurodeles waltl]